MSNCTKEPVWLAVVSARTCQPAFMTLDLRLNGCMSRADTRVYRIRPAAPNVSTTRLALVMAATLYLGSAAVLAQAPANLSLNDAVERAMAANRTVMAARTSHAIDVAGVSAARQRPNPEFSFEAERETPHWAFAGALPV